MKKEKQNRALQKRVERERRDKQVFMSDQSPSQSMNNNCNTPRCKTRFLLKRAGTEVSKRSKVYRKLVLVDNLSNVVKESIEKKKTLSSKRKQAWSASTLIVLSCTLTKY